jgi:digalactosyldiacylglycerol synthase
MDIKEVAIITTAAPPFLTGTSINPLFRGIELAKIGFRVTVLMPWVDVDQQNRIFPTGLSFNTPEEQASYIKDEFMPKDVPKDGLRIRFYKSIFSDLFRSYIMTDAVIQSDLSCDWLIIEEPERFAIYGIEHSLIRKAKRVTGIVHTNYRYYLGPLSLPFEAMVDAAFSRWKTINPNLGLIRLSDAITDYHDIKTVEVNGVRDTFFGTDQQAAKTKTFYFIGKLIWEKGFKELIELLAASGVRSLDVYGKGDCSTQISESAAKAGITFDLKGVTIDPSNDLRKYKTFINASKSEVYCTTTAEALAMGQFVILPEHPSNSLFTRFKNCLTYRTPEDFCRMISFSNNHIPTVDIQLAELSWRSATDRLIDSEIA